MAFATSPTIKYEVAHHATPRWIRLSDKSSCIQF
nr:MAG TPA: hypothetical protein [Caudoviricetes sp.]